MSGRRNYGDPCGVARGLDVIGERWALLVVRDLLLGPKRFGDLLAGLPGVSPNVLSQRLRELAEHGVVRRRDLGPPARVHLYELTEWGRDLEPVLLGLGRWGSRAPSPPEGVLGVDSLLLSVKAAFDPADVAEAARLSGVYEIRVGADIYAAEVTGDGVRIDRRPASRRPDAALTADLDTFRALCVHGTTVEEAVRSGAARLDGDPEARRSLVDLLLAAVPPRRDAAPVTA
ncbi:winged helix-turn-helix transcriptional regulator [Actinomadura harenae]|uniref:Transcriptional regulator n=1 Tax=Actinomadura harenae TaxID=2483351 RepID=A0A3M2LGV2_9ACTN|nr:helix-turn-helix domain-containing protein [Actinomadura harenae]RMI36737.1 transcriptional regulator [Actinomadura harenae]